jgi:AraC family transcriptional regulator of adaptative response/methylated-DNA-[protein]-cysteine methyltransferase
MQKAFAQKDPAFDGTFFVAVKTTGIFCRPVCRAKPPLLKNVEFFATAQKCVQEGYRPCKLCRPTDPNQPSALVKRLVDLVEHKSEPVTERDLRDVGIDPTTARRQFLAAFKTTFTKWQRSRRLGHAMRAINNGANMSTAQLTAGFESSSGFRDALAKLIPSDQPRTNGAKLFHATWISSPLGPLLAVAGDKGVIMLDFIDKGGFDTAALRLKQKLRNCAIVAGEHKHLEMLKSQLGEYFAGTRREFTVPLDPHGTDFERSVWKYLCTIPFAETRTYGQQARSIGKPDSARAVGAANGRNDISILIPCHRVIGASGSLVGYGGGLQRKRWLLDHEKRIAGTELFR